jgi:hypothetical protein
MNAQATTLKFGQIWRHIAGQIAGDIKQRSRLITLRRTADDPRINEVGTGFVHDRANLGHSRNADRVAIHIYNGLHGVGERRGQSFRQADRFGRRNNRQNHCGPGGDSFIRCRLHSACRGPFPACRASAFKRG